MDTMGPVLRRARQRAGLTQATVARLLGVQQATISWWEVNRTPPPLPALVKLARIYGTTGTALMRDAERAMREQEAA